MRLILTLCFLMTGLHAFCTTYYLAENGDDLNDGLTPATPWKTLVHASAQALMAGDSVLFHSGHTFRGTYQVLAVGTSLQPIFFGTYNGSTPAVISGSEIITDWSNAGSGVFKAPFASAAQSLFIDDRLQTNARYPNTGWLRIDSAMGTTGLISNGITDPSGYWDGSTVRVRTTRSTFDVRKVQSQVGNEIVFNMPTSVALQPRFGFYLDGSIAALDTSGEWFYDDLADTLWLIPAVGTDPSTLLVEVPVYNSGLQLAAGSSFVVVDNIRFVQQKEYGLLFNGDASDIRVRNCIFENNQLKALEGLGHTTRLTFSENHIVDVIGMAVTFNKLSKSRIENNVIQRIGLRDGYGIPWDQHGLALGCADINDCWIGNNRIDSTAGMAIRFIGASDTVYRNVVTNALLRLSGELGAAFYYGHETNNVLFQENIFQNVIGGCESCDDQTPGAHGVQIVFNTHDLRFIGNTFANVNGVGLRFGSGAHDQTLLRNTVYNARKGLIERINSGTDTASQTNFILQENVLYALSPTQMCYRLTSDLDSMPLTASDSNYYVNPYNYATIEYNTAVSSSLYTLMEWQQRTQLDSSSRSTYITLPRYHTTGVTGDELITNGQFTNNYNGWQVQPETYMELLLDSWNQMDGGNVKLRFTSKDSGYAQLTSSSFSLTLGQLYQIKFSVYGTRIGIINPEVFEFSNGGYFSAGYKNWRRTFADRRNVIDHFVADNSTSGQSLKIALHPVDSLYWFDNISILPVTADKLDSTFYSRLLVNTTTNPITYDFGDSLFFNLDSVEIDEITLQPFESAVVIYVDGIVTSVSHQGVQSEIRLWPNPASTFINATLPCENGEALYELYDVRGALVKKGSWNKCLERLNVESQTPGLYLLKVVQNGELHTAKLVVTR